RPRAPRAGLRERASRLGDHRAAARRRRSRAAARDGDGKGEQAAHRALRRRGGSSGRALSRGGGGPTGPPPGAGAGGGGPPRQAAQPNGLLEDPGRLCPPGRSRWPGEPARPQALLRHAPPFRWSRPARCAGVVRSRFRDHDPGVHRSGTRALAGSASPLSSQTLDHGGTVARPGGWMLFDHFAGLAASKGRWWVWGALAMILAASTARAQETPPPAPPSGFRPRIVRDGTLSLGMQGEYGSFLGSS